MPDDQHTAAARRIRSILNRLGLHGVDVSVAPAGEPAVSVDVLNHPDGWDTVASAQTAATLEMADHLGAEKVRARLVGTRGDDGVRLLVSGEDLGVFIETLSQTE